jgi:hypothetical protein
MAVLISKVVRSSNRQDGLQEGSSHKTDMGHGTSRVVISGGRTAQNPTHTFLHVSKNDIEDRRGSSGSQTPLSFGSDEHRIMKTIETMVVVEGHEGPQDHR